MYSVLVAAIKLCSWSTIRYDTRCYFNVRSKADMSQLNLPHSVLINIFGHAHLVLTGRSRPVNGD